MHGYVFANNIALTDNQLGIILKFIAMILRTGSQHCPGENDRSFPDCRIAVNRYPGQQSDILADFGFGTDPAKRTDFGTGGNLGTIFNNSSRVNFSHDNNFLSVKLILRTA